MLRTVSEIRGSRLVAAIVLVVAGLTAGCSSFVDRTHAPSQTYWYCWDYGDPDPHHIGHPVEGDHLCTPDELR